MANPRGNEASLTKFQAKWQAGQTQTIRVPVALADQVLSYARILDRGETQPASQQISNESLTQVINLLKEVHTTPRNNFSKDRKALLQTAIDSLVSLTQVNEQN